MSTRAIIGIINDEGSVLGAWQWSDGKGLLPILNKVFNASEKAMSLINEGTWATMFFSKAEKEEFEDWLVNDLYRGRKQEVPEHSYEDVYGVQLLKYKHHTGKAVVYQNYEEAIGQDINYLYLFDPKTNYWSVYE